MHDAQCSCGINPSVYFLPKTKYKYGGEYVCLRSISALIEPLYILCFVLISQACDATGLAVGNVLPWQQPTRRWGDETVAGLTIGTVRPCRLKSGMLKPVLALKKKKSMKTRFVAARVFQTYTYKQKASFSYVHEE